ncbi:MAG: tyrosyl-tRNA synthetase [Solirubrobacteraceae bacterium]|nr:tyrosyl-tRNA synthetase [Solirubrobacteraceae bacterium]
MSQPSPEAAEAAAWLTRNAVDCLPEGALAARLDEGRPLRAKLGVDPTSSDLHLGHTVVLTKLREFQDLGHTAVLIIGDYTARVGDPSGRSALRPVLSGEEIDAHADTYLAQATKVLRTDETLEVRRNSEWLDMAMEDLFRLIRIPTVARLLERDDFAKRFAAHTPISLLELLYPVLQGYDSVAVQADVELGGTDQKFNLLMGRDIQGAYGQREQLILTTPIINGIDGASKMSKSYDNHIGINEAAEEIFGRTMRIPDTILGEWYDVLLGKPVPAGLGPRDAKRALARSLADRFAGAGAGEAAQAAFDQVFVTGGVPDDIAEFSFAGNGGGDIHVPALIADAFGGSRSDARRTLAQGGVKLDGVALAAGDLDLPAERLDGALLQVGKRRFARLRRAP